MGLDMYFDSITRSGDGATQRHDDAIYWRKANQIFAWFENNLASIDKDKGLENCVDYDVTLEEMAALRDVCDKVLKKRDESFSRLVLPTRSGFFFGVTSYGEDYYSDVAFTFDELNKLLNDESVVGGVFHAWW